MPKIVFRWLDEYGHIETIEEHVHEIALFDTPGRADPFGESAAQREPLPVAP